MMGSCRLIWAAMLLGVTSAGADEASPGMPFLGPQRNGVIPATPLWDGSGSLTDRVEWRVKLGGGMSSVAVEGDLLLTTDQDPQSQYVVAIRRRDGKVAWRTPFSAAYKNSMGDGPRATPCVNDGKVYALGGDGVLAACELQTGRLLWKSDLVARLQTRIVDYGQASSPIVSNGLVFVQVGIGQQSVVAVDADSGTLRWKAGRGGSGYSSPAVISLSGRSQLVCLTAGGVSGLDVQSGAELWFFPFETEYDCNTATPIECGTDSVLISAGENHGSVLLRISGNGEGYVVRPVWDSLGARSVLRAEWQTPLLLDGHLYALDNVGSAGPVTHLTCIKAATGERVWREPRFGKGNLIAADGRLWMTTTEGQLIVAEVSPDGYRELSRSALTDFTRQAPVIFEQQLYVRADDGLVCVNVAP